jgi:hypothetical protein
MGNFHMEGEAALEMLERRWFATFKAASAARTECEALLDAMEATEASWNRARVRLAELESLRDALGDEIAALDAGEAPAEASNLPRPRRVMSAA